MIKIEKKNSRVTITRGNELIRLVICNNPVEARSIYNQIEKELQKQFKQVK